MGSATGSPAPAATCPTRPGGRDTPRHPRGLHLDVLDDQDGWVPGLLVAWEHDAAGHWWGRVVTVTDGTATEALYAARRLRPANPQQPAD